MELPVERDGAEVVLTVSVDLAPACRSTGTPASASVVAVDLDDAPWSGELTELEQDDACSRAETDDGGSYWAP